MKKVSIYVSVNIVSHVCFLTDMLPTGVGCGKRLRSSVSGAGKNGKNKRANTSNQ